MAGITLAQAQTQLDAYLAAETAVLSGQAYDWNGKKLTRADLEAIQRGVKTWDDRVKSLNVASRGRSRARTVVIR